MSRLSIEDICPAYQELYSFIGGGAHIVSSLLSKHEGSKPARELEFDKQHLRRLLLPAKELAQTWARYSQHCIWKSYQEHNHIRGWSGGNAIVGCAYHNSYVAKTKTKDVVTPLP
ncbi:uncharacterized protein RHIMIDRAFT_233326 [Rhizopus microsporus ATCC 52813]|uniref:Uncharacterized protein n=1 Tax=Rhizopus microsporus ATCC 52813 TaxID=1340429 RepID=A0A2G4TA79_RHIZD|nr:uncharacterized protein RHIMIDRAFT_233326 [Rhizopus microsporus ATCC 52813]PHZ17903.1 hypothetical protein RHIMIDRAFT_233326 [Rhizopus microsporus ATCC 52813]